MKHFTKVGILLVFSVIGLSSCVKEKDFPIIPVIEFKNYYAYGRDSADCTIKFKDGDGDIGSYGSDSSMAFKMKYLYKGTDNLFHPYDYDNTDSIFDTLFYSYRVPNLTPDGQYKALDGEIMAKLRAAPIYAPMHHVVKFEITLTDRAGHVSNTVSTDEINLP